MPEKDSGVRRFSGDTREKIPMVTRDGPASSVGLTVKVIGREDEDGETITSMGGVRVDFPDRSEKPLFKNLPDMQWARPFYTTYAADEPHCGDLRGRPIRKKKKYIATMEPTGLT